jgi:hypothetical protein
MSSTESRKKVVQRGFVSDIDGAELQAPLIAVTVEKIVVSNRQIKQVTGRNSGRIMIVILGSRRSAYIRRMCFV